MVKSKNVFGVVLLGESFEEAVDRSIMKGGAQGIQHRYELNLVNEAAIIRVVLLEHGPPELLPKSLVGHVLRSDVQSGVMLAFPTIALLQLKGDRE